MTSRLDELMQASRPRPTPGGQVFLTPAQMTDLDWAVAFAEPLLRQRPRQGSSLFGAPPDPAAFPTRED